MSARTIQAADLFCGAGGTSTGLIRAAQDLGCDVELLAVNHWQIAIDTHSANHPNARHVCQSLESVNPREVVPSGKLDLLLASPECVHFSSARGGKPMNDQSRASAWCVLRWLDALDVSHVIIENVREFETWGPLNEQGRPDPTGRGKYFRNFLRNLRCLGYTVDYRVLNAADFGDPTTRLRLFVQARKGKKRIRWPEPTHLAPGVDSLGLYEGMPRWRPAREIIDWSLKGESIFSRKRPLAENTLRRIFAGVQKFSGLPFILPHQHGSSSDGNVRSVDVPLPTVTGTSADMFLAEPFLVVLRNHCDARGLGDPVPTIAAGANHIGVCEPFVVPLNHGKNDLRSHPLGAPMPTVTSVDAWGLAQPSLRPVNHDPEANGAHGWHRFEPCLVPYHRERDGQAPRCHSVDEPAPVIACSNTLGLAEPFLILYHGTEEHAHSLNAPAPTLTTRDRLALVSPQIVRTGQFSNYKGWTVIGWLDILFRMLQPHELAKAMSFPDGYQFQGNREQKVRQIGNAVPCELARALTYTALASKRTEGEGR